MCRPKPFPMLPISGPFKTMFQVSQCTNSVSSVSHETWMKTMQSLFTCVTYEWPFQDHHLSIPLLTENSVTGNLNSNHAASLLCRWDNYVNVNVSYELCVINNDSLHGAYCFLYVHVNNMWSSYCRFIVFWHMYGKFLISGNCRNCEVQMFKYAGFFVEIPDV